MHNSSYYTFQGDEYALARIALELRFRTNSTVWRGFAPGTCLCTGVSSYYARGAGLVGRIEIRFLEVGWQTRGNYRSVDFHDFAIGHDLRQGPSERLGIAPDPRRIDRADAPRSESSQQHK